jgi:hypothetical protein
MPDIHTWSANIGTLIRGANDAGGVSRWLRAKYVEPINSISDHSSLVELLITECMQGEENLLPRKQHKNQARELPCREDSDESTRQPKRPGHLESNKSIGAHTATIGLPRQLFDWRNEVSRKTRNNQEGPMDRASGNSD